jgi:hypothetical protein
MMRQHRATALWLLAVAACGDSAGSPDAAVIPDAAITADAAITPDGAVDPCAEPVSAAIGPAGGELTLCGARLRVPPGLLAAPVTFGIAASTAPAPAEPRLLAGRAFRFTPDDAPLPDVVEIELPHDGTAGRLELFAVAAGELVGVEACTVDERIIGQAVQRLGTFVAVRDAYPYADSPRGLGVGTVSTTIGDDVRTWDVAADGYAIDGAWGGPLALTIIVEHAEGESFDSLRLDVVGDVAGAAEVVDGRWYSEGVIWQLGDHSQPGPIAVIEVVRADGERLEATITGTLRAGEASRALAAAIDVAPAYWQFPPERACIGGPKG